MTKNLQIEYLAIGLMKSYKNNPKIHTDKQIHQIARSITEFEFNNPILIDENNEIIAGHGRLLAAELLKLTEVPAIRLTHLTTEQKRLYRIADNKLTENGQWDIDLLRLEFEELEEIADSLDLSISGFETSEIDILLESAKPLDKKLNNIPFIPESEIITKSGDIWQLGEHKVFCGDALSQSSFEALLEDRKADMVFADPPYNVKINGHVCGKGISAHREFAMASGEMSQDDFKTFLNANFTLLNAFSKDGSIHFICMDWRHISEIIAAATPVYTELKNICVWNKDNGGMGSLYRSKHELIFVYKNGKVPHTNNVELGKYGRYRTNVWDYAGVNSFGKNRNNLRLHPTVKPVELVRDAILDVSKRGEVVLDSFLGSGSTLIAAEKAGRVCCGIELEPLYVDTTIRRFINTTGKNVINKQTGKTYSELLDEKRRV